MKYEEALHEISTMVYRNTDDFSMRISKDCYKKIIEALEKQIPKKPVKSNSICYAKTKDGKELHAYTYRCTVCYANVKIGTHHCSCGQTLDWSDKE